MINITLRQLRYFEALAQQGHFGRAADAAAVSQPALSVQIKELETTLGQTLIERGPRSVRLTSFGQAFRLRAQEILRSVDELGDLARAMGDGLAGALRLGVIPTVAPYLLPKVVQGIQRAYPQVELRIRESQTQQLVQALKDGALDLAIVALPIGDAGFVEEALFEEEFVLVRPRADAEKPVPGRDQLREMQLLLLEEGHCFRDQTLGFCNTPAATARDGLDGSSLSTLVQMVGAGIGVTMIPQMAVEVETRSANVSCTTFAGPQPGRTVGMIWRKSNPLADAFSGVREVVRSCAGRAQVRR